MMGLTVIFVWALIRGNERGDKVAKKQQKVITLIWLLASAGHKSCIIKQRLKERWLKQWEEERKGRWFLQSSNESGKN